MGFAGVVTWNIPRFTFDNTYENIEIEPNVFGEISDGLYFSQYDIFKRGELVDRVSAIKIDPEKNKIKVTTGYRSPNNYELYTIDEWCDITGALACFNSAQYSSDPYAMPVAMVLSEGRVIGPRYNKKSKGMLVSEPTKDSLPNADLLDYDFDYFNPDNPQYYYGVQHWPILLDRNGKIRVKSTDWQANRTVVAKDNDGKILAMTSEGGFFTLHNFGKFLKDSGLDIITAMNLDGGYEAEMCIKTNRLNYVTYGQYETYGASRNVSIIGARCKIPTVIGIYKR